jgi:uncharacterized membrane protein YfcA
MSMTLAAPVALLAVGLAALIGALDGLRRGIVRYKAAILMSAAGALTAPIGLAIAQELPAVWLLDMFALLMFLLALRMYRQASRHDGPSPNAACPAKPCMLSQETGRLIWNARSAATLSAVGVVSGLFTGMLGVGGGFIIVPALRQFTNVSMNGIVATSLMVIALISTATVGSAVRNGFELPSVAVGFVLCASLGLIVGRRLAPRIPARLLQKAFAVICAAVACLMLFKAHVIA